MKCLIASSSYLALAWLLLWVFWCAFYSIWKSLYILKVCWHCGNTIRILPPKSAVAWSRNLPPVEHISPCYECFDSLRSLSISFSPQLKTCHQARQTYEINLLESCESVSVRTSYFKAIVSRHALARLIITCRLDTRYTNTTSPAIPLAVSARSSLFSRVIVIAHGRLKRLS